MTIDGGTGVTIDANQLSRVLVQANYTNVVLDDLTITGGKTTADQIPGGGILAALNTTLTLIDTTVSGNSTAGVNCSGGGISPPARWRLSAARSAATAPRARTPQAAGFMPVQ